MPYMITLIVSAPERPESRVELAQKIAAVHADAVLRRLKALPIPPVQRKDILHWMQAEYREQAGR